VRIASCVFQKVVLALQGQRFGDIDDVISFIEGLGVLGSRKQAQVLANHVCNNMAVKFVEGKKDGY